jgi:hypothetical protein
MKGMLNVSAGSFWFNHNQMLQEIVLQPSASE